MIDQTDKKDGLTLRYALLAFFVFIIYVRFYEIELLQFLTPLQLTRVSMVLALILYFLSPDDKKFLWKESTWKWFISLQVLSLGLMPLSIWKSNSFNWFKDTNIRIIITFFILIVASSYGRRVFSLSKIIFISCVCAALRVISALMSGMYIIDQGAKRVVGVGVLGSSDPNDVALILAMAVPLGLHYVRISKGINKILSLGSVLILLAAIINTGSRGGFLGLVLGTFVFFATTLRKKKIQFIITALLIGSLGWIVLPSDYKGRVQTMFDETEYTHTDDAHGRVGIWKRAVGTIAKRPWGYGLKTSVTANNTFNPAEQNHWIVIHNSYLEIGLDLGVLGLLLYLLLLGSGFSNIGTVLKLSHNNKQAESLACGLAGGLSAFLISSFFLSQAYYWNQYIFLALSVALKHITVLNSESKNHIKPNLIEPNSLIQFRQNNNSQGF